METKPVKIEFKTKSGKTVSFPAKKIVAEKKSKAGRKLGSKDTKPRQLNHPRWKKKVSDIKPAESVSQNQKLPVIEKISEPEKIVASVPLPQSPVPSFTARSPEKTLSTKSDTEFFAHGTPPKPPENVPGQETPKSDLPPLNEPAKEEKKETPMGAAEADGIASMIWSAELNLAAGFFGGGMMPRKYVPKESGQADPKKGEIPFDESEMVRGAWRDYLVSLGITILSPLKKLWLAHAFYFVPRVGIVIGKIKARFGKKNVEIPFSQASETARKETKKEEPGKPAPQTPVEIVETIVPGVPQEKPQSNVNELENFR